MGADWVFEGRGFKETGVFPTEGEHRAAAPDRMSTKACKPKILT